MADKMNNKDTLNLEMAINFFHDTLEFLKELKEIKDKELSTKSNSDEEKNKFVKFQ